MDKSTKKREIIIYSALSILRTGTTVIPWSSDWDFDDAFIRAFNKCGLSNQYPYVLGLVHENHLIYPWELIDEYANTIPSHHRIQHPATWAYNRDQLNHRRKIVVFTDYVDTSKQPDEIVEKLVQQTPPECDWELWKPFGKELIDNLERDMNGGSQKAQI